MTEGVTRKGGPSVTPPHYSLPHHHRSRNMNVIARTERAAQAWQDRLLDDYLTEGTECPECGQNTIESDGGADRRGRWWKDVCENDECDYINEDCDIYDDY